VVADERDVDDDGCDAGRASVSFDGYLASRWPCLECRERAFQRDRPGADQLNAEIYSPPYLFNGARPSITSAPTSIAYGSTFSVTTPDAAQIAKVSLVRLSTVTHSFNTGQRYLSLNFQQVAGGLTVTAPANGNLAPPGYYMLFILNANGVPSIAPLIQVH
jgi:hypothetical protein